MFIWEKRNCAVQSQNHFKNLCQRMTVDHVNFKMNFDENLHDRRIVNKCNLNLTFHFQIISLNNQGIYIFMVDWLGLATLSRLWIKTDGFSSSLALLLQTLPPLSRVKHSDGQLVSWAQWLGGSKQWEWSGVTRVMVGWGPRLMRRVMMISH